MAQEQAVCAFCKKTGIDPEKDYKKVSGFTRKRQGGGVNALKLQEYSGEWAHKMCVDMQAAGHNLGQGGLFG